MNYDLNVLSLGAGVQSTALLLMAEQGRFPTQLDLAIFADTQWEPAAVYAQLDQLEKATTTPIVRITVGNLRTDVIQALDTQGVGHMGQPPLYVRNNTPASGETPDAGGALWRKCTKKYKIDPIQQAIRTHLGYQPRQRVKQQVRQWFGISIDEATRQRDARVPWIDNYYPLVEHRLTRADCQAFLEGLGWTTPVKSACIGCPYHSNATWAHMRDHQPEEWKDAVDFDAQLRTGRLPGVTGQAYLHRRMVPLSEAVDQTHDPDQLDLFEDDCEGVCGV